MKKAVRNVMPADIVSVKQVCPKCGHLIGIIPGSRDAICKNCGFKDPCCE